MEAIWVIAGIAIGFGVRWIIDNSNKKLQDNKLEQARRDGEAASGRVRALEQANLALSDERAELRGEVASLKSSLEAAERLSTVSKSEYEMRLLTSRQDSANTIRELKAAHDRQISQIQEEARNLRQESEAQWQLKFDKLREEFKTLTANALTAKQTALQDANREQMGELLGPIREQFEQFRKAVDESRTSGEVAKKELKASFETTMRLFEQQQRMTVEELRRETTRIGEDAANLTRALKRDTKAQGDWGEMILDKLLESSGLERDVHYFIQEDVKDEEGNHRRPDVVVRFPEKRAIVIDSKTSLTAYAEAFATDDETVRLRKLREHAKSVRRHIDELAEKKYDELVEDSISFVLMFIPNDQCYLSAMEQDNTLGSYAYSKGIVIISPSNLLIALQLSYNMWQRDRQDKNTQKIVTEATAIFDKAANFTKTFLKAQAQLETVVKTFDTARRQMYDGNGSVLRKLWNWKETRGINSKKTLEGFIAGDDPLEIEEESSANQEDQP